MEDKKEDPYRITARIYDLITGPAVKIMRKIGLQLFPPQDNISILDIGCGTGTQLALYSKAGCKLYGVDTSPAMLAIARRKLGEAGKLYLEDASHMTFYDQMFDLVMIVFALHEMPAYMRRAAMSECERVVKPDGRVIIIDHAFGPYSFPIGYASRCLRIMLEIIAGLQHYSNYCDFRMHGGLEPLISETKFSVEKKVVLKSGVAVVYLLQL